MTLKGYLVRDKSCPSRFFIFEAETPPVERNGEWVFGDGPHGKLIPLDMDLLYDLQVNYPSFTDIRKIKITIEEEY